MRRATTHLLVSVGLVAVLIAAAALPAIAYNDLDELLERIESAEFSGSQIIVTTWDGITEVSVVTVDHAGDVTLVDGGDGVAMLGQGRAMGPGGRNGAAVAGWNEVTSDRYEVVMGATVNRQGRPAQAVEIREGALLRARLVIDVATGAPLVSEVFDGDGRRFRYTAMFDFTPWSEGIARPPEPVFDVSVPADSGPIEAVAGYVRADTYASPDDSLHSYFSDGLFSFSLFRFDGAAAIEDDGTLETFSVVGREYRRRVTPTDVNVTWEAGGSTYVLIGDLPPDHLEEVLEGLPRPRRRGFLSRLWSGLFG